MTDYSKLKVNELKEELKARGIPLTGLKLKQNFIDKLVEADASGQTNAAGAVVAPASIKERVEAKEQNSTRDSQDVKSRDGQGGQNFDVTSTQPVTQNSIVKDKNDLVSPGSVNGETDLSLDDALAQPQSSPDNAPEETIIEPMSRDGTIEEIVPEDLALNVIEGDERSERTTIPAVDGPGTPVRPPQIIETTPPSTIPAAATATSIPTSIQVPVKELIEDSKKRKRRSVTPPPSEADIAQKRAKARDGSPRITKSANLSARNEDDPASEFAGQKAMKETQSESSALEQRQAATDAAEVLREGDGLPEGEQSEIVGATSIKSREAHRKEEPMLQPLPESAQSPEKQSGRPRPGVSLFGGLKRVDPDIPQEPPPSKHSGVGGIANQSTLPHRESEEKAVAPALHPATSSLYVRNLKRPLHLPTLRTHIAKIAQGPSSPSNIDEDPIVAYFLDNIRTHALLSFRSITAASRVRSALHETRYPDEKTRDPLWVDFVPDDKVMSWIDIETNSGGRGAAQRWEVVYEESLGGIEAVLQEVGGGAGPRRPSTVSQRQPSMSGVQRQSSMSDLPRPAPVAGVHPDRLPLVPQARTHATDSSRETQRRFSQPETSGTGFRALDELFSFTIAKPKLYYKPVSQQVADWRINAIKDLRVGHANMGKSGDEDMKRYSFEMYRGEEEWVDKGPEFGYGRRGVERMRGGAPMRGGYRGGGGGGGGNRGGYRDRDRDDVWRGARR